MNLFTTAEVRGGSARHRPGAGSGDPAYSVDGQAVLVEAVAQLVGEVDQVGSSEVDVEVLAGEPVLVDGEEAGVSRSRVGDRPQSL
jgi:hypothetical protein